MTIGRGSVLHQISYAMGAPQWGQNLDSLILPHTGHTFPWGSAPASAICSRQAWSWAIFSWDALTAATRSATAAGGSPSAYSQTYHCPMAR